MHWRPNLRRPLEKGAYESIITLLRLANCDVYRMAQARASTQSLGFPDLFAFAPISSGLRTITVEVKRPGGKVRPEQAVFQERCIERGMLHVVGGTEEVLAALQANGLLVWDQRTRSYRRTG